MTLTGKGNEGTRQKHKLKKKKKVYTVEEKAQGRFTEVKRGCKNGCQCFHHWGQGPTPKPKTLRLAITFSRSLEAFQQLLLCWTLSLVSLCMKSLTGVSQFITAFWISWPPPVFKDRCFWSLHLRCRPGPAALPTTWETVRMQYLSHLPQLTSHLLQSVFFSPQSAESESEIWQNAQVTCMSLRRTALHNVLVNLLLVP